MARSGIWALVLVACGGVSTPVGVDAGDASVPPDAAGDAGGCVTSPNVGDACTSGQTSCDSVDPCCAQTVVCDGATHTWKVSGIACLLCSTIPCGAQTCTGGSVCVARGPGMDGGGTSHECVPLPSACSRNWTCGCVTKNLPASCTLSPTGGCDDQAHHVTLTCMGM